MYDKIKEGEDYPTYIYGTDKQAVMSIDINDVISNACEEGYEEMTENLDYTGVDEIQILIDQWIEKQGDSNYCYYENDEVILLDELIKDIQKQIKEENKL